MKRWFTALLALVLAVPALASDQALWEKSTLNQIMKRGELRVGLEAGYMPFEMRDKNGNIIGFDVDLAKKMASVLKVKVSFVNTQWDGIIPALLTDKFDIIMGGMTITPERNAQVNFSQPYIVVGQAALLSSKLKGKISEARQLDDPKYTIATKLGTSGDITATRMMTRARIKRFETEADAALEVKNGRADAFIYDFPFLAIYANQYPEGVSLLPEPFTKEALGWAFRKGDPDFENWLNNFLLSIKNDGTYDVLYQRWFQGTAWLKNVQ
ncbi:amino acid ABC transporter substrate-binding protein [Stagnimonas aquatica]|uniref:Amino acid ABC transporter substrate-binding protein n=1 Tax=Stagnimonas aquatica TaxID=2689987 RepID=A0A3N0V5B7_9GAMM|nr:transporter substrate-binding domain-containing protein [Stagnimonas aquatica]ROH87782.1 amino acid ABC transporter substrate-binding protein [Stagnimonas aquatica]